MIKGITFDLWDTVFIDDSDEPKRKAADRPTKAVERRQLIKRFIDQHSPISQDIVNAVYDAVDASFRKVWHEQHLTWNVRERLELVFKGIGFALPVNEMQELIRLHEEMELEFRPDFISGIHDAIKHLHGKYKLGVISDAIFSPGRALRKLLKDEGLLDYFDVFIFSDEVGQSKPHPLVFKAACEALGIESHELVHIGDREHNDIIGPRKLGIQSVLCIAALDRGSENTQAKAMFKEYSELPKIIDMIDQS